ncbi:MAG TPA: condensation domain-containing protein, partial [Pyrinomonadaceae bacterium]
LTEGPLVRVALFERGAGRTARLLFVAHHLVVDGVSWRVLLADLQTACEQLRGGQPVRLPAKTTSYKRWAERLSEHARSEKARAELDYWLGEHAGPVAPLPVDFAGGERLESSSDIVAVTLDVEETEALLREVPKFRRLRINDILLAALARGFARWTGGGLLLELEGHGREEVVEGVDVSRTVGWFTSIFPVRLDLGDAATPGEVLQTVRERLERVPHAGVGYGMLRYLGGEEAAAKLASLPRAEVSFNYLGQADQSFGENSLLRLAQESAGPTAGPETVMPHLLYVNGIIYQGRLLVRFKYSKNVHRTETVEALARSYVEELRALIAYCREAGAAEAGESAREFPLAPAGGEEFEAALARVEFAREGGGRGPARANVEDVYPLSPAQEGILFHSIYAPESGVYVVQIHCSLRAPDVRAVERAWQAVVERNPILRTAFVWENVARPLQVVGRSVAVQWQHHDWRDAPPDEQAQRFDRYLEGERARGFELTQAPLMRMGLIRVGDDEYKFVWNHHHLLLDGWSIYLVFKELFTLYDSFTLDVAAESEPTRPFGEYIDWLQSRDPVEVEEFWRRALKGFDSPTPVGREMGDAVRDGEERHGELRLELSAADTEAVRVFARQHRLTVNTVVQGAWALLLGHTGGRHDVAFGATASGRPPELPGIETMVGMFINVLPMRVKLPDGEPLAAWLEGIQQAQSEARQYEYSPLVQVQRFSGVPRGVPLFESILSFENYPVDDSIQEYSRSLNLSDVYNVSRTNYPLTIIVAPRAEQMALRFVYDRRRFDAAAAGHLASQFQTLMREFAARPDATLGELRQALARADEGQRLVGEGRAEESKRARFKAIKPKAVSLPSEPVKMSPLSAESPLPLVVEPATADADLAGWAAHNREAIGRRLGEHGALLLRGFTVDSVDKFEQVAGAVCPRLFGEYGDLPREGEGGKVYGSTPYPADQSILFHNESSHLHRWPMKIFFYCVRAAQAGGETPVVDCREVYRLLPRAVAARFAEKGLMYVRNFIEGLDISWQSFYGTADRGAVEARCRESGTEFEWRGDNGLRTRRVCPAVARHPRTGETVFFNQVQLHHVSCLEQSVRETLLSMYRGEELPRNVYYGDGSPIEDSVVAEVVETYRRAAVSFPWREGDILLLDNMLTAHARNPYTGTRKIVVAMGEMTGGGAAANGGA